MNEKNKAQLVSTHREVVEKLKNGSNMSQRIQSTMKLKAELQGTKQAYVNGTFADATAIMVWTNRALSDLAFGFTSHHQPGLLANTGGFINLETQSAVKSQYYQFVQGLTKSGRSWQILAADLTQQGFQNNMNDRQQNLFTSSAAGSILTHLGNKQKYAIKTGMNCKPIKVPKNAKGEQIIIKGTIGYLTGAYTCPQYQTEVKAVQKQLKQAFEDNYTPFINAIQKTVQKYGKMKKQELKKQMEQSAQLIQIESKKQGTIDSMVDALQMHYQRSTTSMENSLFFGSTEQFASSCLRVYKRNDIIVYKGILLPTLERLTKIHNLDTLKLKMTMAKVVKEIRPMGIPQQTWFQICKIHFFQDLDRLRATYANRSMTTDHCRTLSTIKSSGQPRLGKLGNQEMLIRQNLMTKFVTRITGNLLASPAVLMRKQVRCGQVFDQVALVYSFGHQLCNIRASMAWFMVYATIQCINLLLIQRDFYTFDNYQAGTPITVQKTLTDIKTIFADPTKDVADLQAVVPTKLTINAKYETIVKKYCEQTKKIHKAMIKNIATFMQKIRLHPYTYQLIDGNNGEYNYDMTKPHIGTMVTSGKYTLGTDPKMKMKIKPCKTMNQYLDQVDTYLNLTGQQPTCNLARVITVCCVIGQRNKCSQQVSQIIKDSLTGVKTHAVGCCKILMNMGPYLGSQSYLKVLNQNRTFYKVETLYRMTSVQQLALEYKNELRAIMGSTKQYQLEAREEDRTYIYGLQVKTYAQRKQIQNKMQTIAEKQEKEVNRFLQSYKSDYGLTDLFQRLNASQNYWVKQYTGLMKKNSSIVKQYGNQIIMKNHTILLDSGGDVDKFRKMISQVGHVGQIVKKIKGQKMDVSLVINLMNLNKLELSKMLQCQYQLVEQAHTDYKKPVIDDDQTQKNILSQSSYGSKKASYPHPIKSLDLLRKASLYGRTVLSYSDKFTQDEVKIAVGNIIKIMKEIFSYQFTGLDKDQYKQLAKFAKIIVGANFSFTGDKKAYPNLSKVTFFKQNLYAEKYLTIIRNLFLMSGKISDIKTSIFKKDITLKQLVGIVDNTAIIDYIVLLYIYQYGLTYEDGANMYLVQGVQEYLQLNTKIWQDQGLPRDRSVYPSGLLKQLEQSREKEEQKKESIMQSSE